MNESQCQTEEALNFKMLLILWALTTIYVYN
jgi:hypothetical protein